MVAIMPPVQKVVIMKIIDMMVGYYKCNCSRALKFHGAAKVFQSKQVHQPFISKVIRRIALVSVALVSIALVSVSRVNKVELYLGQ